jgi:hypothetical protein
MARRPPQISNRKGEFDPEILWTPGLGLDPARYLVNPGTVTAPGKHSPGHLRHARPYLANGSNLYVFPTGIEGFKRTGSAQLGLRHYIGDNSVEGVTMHFEEGRIELSGTFPGTSAQDNMVECLAMLRSKTKERGLVLYAPGVFDREQYVLPENWDFTHTEDDRTHSIGYTITFVRIGEGRKVKDPRGTPPPYNPGFRIKPKGKPTRIFKMKDGVRTLRAMAKKVYGSANKWPQIVELNYGQLQAWDKGTGRVNKASVPSHKLPTHRWPVGTRWRY